MTNRPSTPNTSPAEEAQSPQSPWKRQWPNDNSGQAPAAPSMTSPQGKSWRLAMDKGNTHYAVAKGNVAQGDACESAVKEALKHYNEAVRLGASNAALLSSSYKNVCLVSGLVAKDDTASPEMRHHFLSEALNHAALAIAWGASSDKGKEWIGVLIDATLDLVSGSLLDAANIVSAASGGVLQLLASLAHRAGTQPHVRMIAALALLDRANKKGASALAEGDPVKAVDVIDERSDLIHSVAEWGGRPECAGFLDAVDDTRAALRNTRTLGRATRHVREGKRLRDLSVADGIDMDLVFRALDEFRAGIVECHNLHLDIEAELLSEIGYIWSHVLKVREAAHVAFRACLLCVHACYPREFRGQVWYKRALDAEENYQRETALEAQRLQDEADAPFLKEIQPQLDELKDANTSLEAVLKYIATTYPGTTPFTEFDASVHVDGKEKHYSSLLRKILVKFHEDKVVGEPRKVQLLHRAITLALTDYINSAKGL